MPTRRAVVAALLIPPAARAAGRAPVVTVLGDSITAGYGLPAAQALPAQLEAALAALGVPARVRAAGVSGDTTAGGLARLDFSVQPDTAVCVVVLGGNDLLQGVEPAETRANLDRIVKRLKARRISVVLAGGRAPGRSLGAYGRAFDQVFPAVAATNRIALAPDLLAGISDRPEMKQADGLHPNAAGARLIARRLAPEVARALRARA
jgi:acyl-CoA thioesterase-1